MVWSIDPHYKSTIKPFINVLHIIFPCSSGARLYKWIVNCLIVGKWKVILLGVPEKCRVKYWLLEGLITGSWA